MRKDNKTVAKKKKGRKTMIKVKKPKNVISASEKTHKASSPTY